MDTSEKYGVTKEDLQRLASFSGIPIFFCDEDDADDEQPLDETEAGWDVPSAGEDDIEFGTDSFGDPFGQDGIDQNEIDQIVEEIGKTALSTPGDEFARFVACNHMRIYRAAHADDRVVESLLLGYRLGIASGSGACMNDLGALYYIGEIVEQDYAKAAELYEMAMAHGCCQSIINLGYIYEYGRTGERDYDKAYRLYSLAAALEPGCEALYKLGDMYARGKAVERNMVLAMALWERSLALAQGVVLTAQPALRIAQLLIDPDCVDWNIEPDPLRALSLFQQAEIGLRIDITENGLTYYRKRLQEAVDGEARARELARELGY